MAETGNGLAELSSGPSAGPSVSSGKQPAFSLQDFEDLVNIPKSEYEELLISNAHYQLKASAELDHLKILLAEKRVKGEIQAAGGYSSSSQNNRDSDSINSPPLPAPRRKQDDSSKDEEHSPQDDSDNKRGGQYSTIGVDFGAEHRGHELVGDKDRRNNDSEPCMIALRTPTGVTHADIINAIRGGLLMDIHLLPHRNACFVTFLNHRDAENFMAYCQSHVFYVARRSVSIRLALCSIVNPIPPLLTPEIQTPVIWAGRQCQRPGITEDMIRHDLDHIHNMVIIYVQLSEGNAYLSTNSVSNALYARTCMLSRTMYRGLEIGFYPDECDGDIDDMDDSAPLHKLPPVEKDAHVYNSYHVLSVERVEDEDDGNQGSVEDNEDEEPEPY
ncbi:hypothetical protein N7510_009866 [Penicillium lagena]|uniref:uncharacterized protein n=1 Tax=Penicillium lagena TaxID=94218 RepID=UPI0025401715|nr:uncharacterized protein N7510_009866 [Penicillium lagena]KAJ5604712.1 hypothetical protein N7510_009866 [Penicillium lagena]